MKSYECFSLYNWVYSCPKYIFHAALLKNDAICELPATIVPTIFLPKTGRCVPSCTGSKTLRTFRSTHYTHSCLPYLEAELAAFGWKNAPIMCEVICAGLLATFLVQLFLSFSTIYIFQLFMEGRLIFSMILHLSKVDGQQVLIISLVVVVQLWHHALDSNYK